MIISPLIRFLAPHNCLSCGVEGKILCAWCQADGLPPLPSRCYRCHKQTPDFATCGTCRHHSRLRHVWIAAEYGGIGQGLVQKLKFERSPDPAAIIAGWLAEKIPFFTPDVIVAHVPTATSRRRQRGYDQSEIIAKSLAVQLNLPFETVLARTGQSRQVGANRQKRTEQLKYAFRPLGPHKIKGSSFLLVDDIVTTGATLESAARTLRLAGAKAVDAAVFAQKKKA